MLTIQKWLEGVGRNRQQVSECPSWPPDLFAICASLLKRSGTYLRLFERRSRRTAWTGARAAGIQWRKNIDARNKVTAANLKRAVPPEVHVDWATLIKASGTDIGDIADDSKLSDALIRLTVIADAHVDELGHGGTKPASFAGDR
jgi:hypothetical protein